MPILHEIGIDANHPIEPESNDIAEVKKNLIEGAFFAALVIFFFLRNLRATIIATLAIPISVIATFSFMNYLGFTINNLTMLGLTISVGMLVDDAIVVMENIYRHMEMGKTRFQAAREGTAEIGLAKAIEPVAPLGSQTDTAPEPPVTDPGTAMGTVGYMSPEQVRGRELDHRSDIFSFGTVLYEMLSGRPAFQGDSAVETLNAILTQEPAALSREGGESPPGLERILGRCLEKRPEQRFQTALGDLWLIRRIGRVPGRVLQNIAQNRSRCGGAVVALADQ